MLCKYCVIEKLLYLYLGFFFRLRAFEKSHTNPLGIACLYHLGYWLLVDVSKEMFHRLIDYLAFFLFFVYFLKSCVELSEIRAVFLSVSDLELS